MTYTKYVWEFVTTWGETRYAVGQWDQEKGQYIRPFDKAERRLTGCSAEYARRPNGLQNYATRKEALARARYLFGTMEER